eukprot:5695496-Pleurochrysis_carterae.AAC.1
MRPPRTTSGFSCTAARRCRAQTTWSLARKPFAASRTPTATLSHGAQISSFWSRALTASWPRWTSSKRTQTTRT